MSSKKLKRKRTRTASGGSLDRVVGARWRIGARNVKRSRWRWLHTASTEAEAHRLASALIKDGWREAVFLPTEAPQRPSPTRAPLAAEGTEQYQTEREILVAVSRLDYIREHGRDPKHDNSYLSVEDATEAHGR